jgi:hypothetical protein
MRSMKRVGSRVVAVLGICLLGVPCAVAAIAEDEPRTDPLERVWTVLSSPWLRHNPVVRRLRDQVLIAFFPRYPYRDRRLGYLVLRPPFPDDHRFRLWGARLALAGGAGGGGSALAGVDAAADTSLRAGARVRWQRSREDGIASDGGMITGTYRWLQSSTLLSRLGVGARWGTGRSSGAGIAATLAIEVFPSPPWLIALDADIGTIGTRGAGGASLRIGRTIRAIECSAGILLQSDPPFRGPIAQLAYWF